MEEYTQAPQPRQLDIYRFLISTALNKDQPDIVQQNSYNALYTLHPHTNSQVILDCSKDMVEHIGKKAPELRVARVAIAAGLFPYLRKAQVKELFSEYLARMKQIGTHWTKNPHHGELLRNFIEIGGLSGVPDELLSDYLEWLVLCYIGEPGGYGAGQGRRVFYSNTGGPLSLDILKEANRPIAKVIAGCAKSSPKVKAALTNEHVSRRYESILDAVQANEEI